MTSNTPLPRSLPMHPVDLVSGFLVPQLQTYLVAAPPFAVNLAGACAKLAPLLTGSFPRLCYRLRKRLGTVRSLELAEDVVEPIAIVDPSPLEPRIADGLPRALAERHWQLLIAPGPDLTVLALQFDHFLGHGELARSFLGAACDRLRGDASAPPVLDKGQQAAFDRLGTTLVEQLHQTQPWAAYRRLEVDGRAVRRLARAQGARFTEGLMLWLARALQAAAREGGRERMLDAMCFRMDEPATGDGPRDPAQGNDGLLLEQWEVDPGGAHRRKDAGPQRSREALKRFARFYRRLPAKPLVNGVLRGAIAAARHSGHRVDRERLIVNNLGHTDHPFFRPLFFDPVNDRDSIGLVFVDGHRDRLLLQFSPPRRYLDHFDWAAFEQRLRTSLQG